MNLQAIISIFIAFIIAINIWLREQQLNCDLKCVSFETLNSPFSIQISKPIQFEK